jgi:zinc transport system substrate-binding protein
MKKNIIVLFIVLIVIVGIVFVGFRSNNNKVKEDKIFIVTTLFPLYDFAKQIGQDKVEASILLPAGIEAHSFEPKPSDIVKVNEADIFIYTGEFMEPWAKNIIDGVSNENLRIINISRGVKLLHAEENHEHEEDHDHKEDNHAEKEEDDHNDENDHHHDVDPHIWLDFDNNLIMIDNILEVLIEIDPENTIFYQKNADEYKEKIMALDDKYRTILSICKNRDIIYSGHYAFGYMARKYNLNYKSAYGLSPNQEPGAQDLIEIIEKIKKDKIDYIFSEELMSPKLSQMLNKETNTDFLILNPAHNVTKDDFQNGVDYLLVMERNLTNLAKGLDCSQ